MKVNPQTDELLSAFIDGELSPRQQTEVQRMAAHDPDMAQRLQQLRSCRTLINVLPRAEAPADMLEQIKASLERRSLLDEQSMLTGTRAGARHLKIRRFLAAAAMIALVGVLGLVVYQIISPVPHSSRPEYIAGTTVEVAPAPVVQVAAETPFSGRLELTTTSLEQATSFIKKSAWDNGLASLPPDETGGRVVCRIQGRREALESLLASLGTMGQLVKNARLIVDTDRFTVPVIIESVTFPQVAGLLSQATTPQRLQVAKEMAMLNQFAREIRGREMQLAADQKLGNAFAELATTPRPWLAQGRKPSDTTPLEGDVQGMASLTIVLLSAQ